MLSNALGDGVVDVDGREAERAGFHPLVETMDACGRLLGDAADRLGHGTPEIVALVRPDLVQESEDHRVLLAGGRFGAGDGAALLVLGPQVDQKSRIAAVVQQEIRPATVRPAEGLLGAPPVLLQGLALPCEYGNT
jgi:hypothetical protein